MDKVQIVEVDGEKRFKVICDDGEAIITWYDLLSVACEMADDGEFEDADVLLSVASSVYHPEGIRSFNVLYRVVRTRIARIENQRRTKACLN